MDDALGFSVGVPLLRSIKASEQANARDITDCGQMQRSGIMSYEDAREPKSRGTFPPTQTAAGINYSARPVS